MSDVEPKAPYPGAPSDQTKQGGLKDQNAKPADTSDGHTGQSEVKEDDAHGSEGGGMIGEG